MTLLRHVARFAGPLYAATVAAASVAVVVLAIAGTPGH